MISVLILTRNEQQDLPDCLASVAWSDDVHVLDSFSTDSTVAIAQASGAEVHQRVFDDYLPRLSPVAQHAGVDLQSTGPVRLIQKALATDPHMRVLIAHGFTDLSCPFMASQLIIDQIPNMGDPTRLKLGLYPGGHMFYSRPDSQAAFRRDVMALYGAH